LRVPAQQAVQSTALPCLSAASFVPSPSQLKVENEDVKIFSAGIVDPDQANELNLGFTLYGAGKGPFKH
jgi:hypothetical protein